MKYILAVIVILFVLKFLYKIICINYDQKKAIQYLANFNYEEYIELISEYCSLMKKMKPSEVEAHQKIIIQYLLDAGVINRGEIDLIQAKNTYELIIKVTKPVQKENNFFSENTNEYKKKNSDEELANSTLSSFQTIFDNPLLLFYGDIKNKPINEKEKYLFFYAGAIDFLSQYIDNKNSSENWFYTNVLATLNKLDYANDNIMQKYGNKNDPLLKSSMLGMETMKYFINSNYDVSEASSTMVLLNHLENKDSL